jgi:hypothetical protein
MNVTRARYLLLPAVCLAAGLAACQQATNSNQAQTPDGRTAGQAVTRQSDTTIGELLELTVAGGGKAPVKRWTEIEAPHVEAYSFIEYPLEYAAGHAYYWGDWNTRAADYCAVRMLRDYTPVQIDFTLGWYAAVSGRSVAQLRDEYMAAHQRYGGTVEENIGASGQRVGDSYHIETEQFRAGLFTRDDRGEGLTIFGLMLKPDQLAAVDARNREFTDLLKFATADQPATLAELIAILSGTGARGILDHFDFSDFKQHFWYEPLDGSDQRDYHQATIYNSGPLHWNNPELCYLAAFDDGQSAQLTFTTGWYESHCGHSAAELDAAFEQIFAAAGNGRFGLDSVNASYDVDFAWAYLDRVNVVRRRYLKPPAPDHALYMLLAGDELFPDAPPRFPAWTPDELPSPAEDTQVLEQLIREIAATPPSELPAKFVPGAMREQFELEYQLIQPFTMRDYYTVTDPVTRRRHCEVQLLDESYLESFGFNHEWFTAQTGLAAGELERGFAALAARFGAEASALSMQPGDRASFSYGPLTIEYQRGRHDDHSDDWYSISPPIWPD